MKNYFSYQKLSMSNKMVHYIVHEQLKKPDKITGLLKQTY